MILPLEAWPAGALGEAYQILPSGLQFDPPATLTFTYGAEIGNLAPVDVKIATAVGSKWAPLATRSIRRKRSSLLRSRTSRPTGSSVPVLRSTRAKEAREGEALAADGSGADATAPIDASTSDAGLLGCQVICTNIDGCNCHTVGLCGGHNYSCSGAGSCTCFTDTTGGPTILRLRLREGSAHEHRGPRMRLPVRRASAGLLRRQVTTLMTPPLALAHEIRPSGRVTKSSPVVNW